jgi:hypothetical protein
MMQKVLSFSLGILGCIAAGPAIAGVCANFAASDINVTYDPLGTQGVSQIVQPVSLRVARQIAAPHSSQGTTVLAQFMDWDSNTTLRIGYHGPIYTIEGDNTVVVGRSDAPLMPNRYFHHDFHSRNTGVYENIHGLRFFIDPGQDVPAGVYNEDLDVQYRCVVTGHDKSSTDLQSGVLHVSVNVPSKLIANLSGGSTSGTLDFGDFSDRSRSAMVNVYSTGPFSVQIKSDHHAAMLLDGASHHSDDTRIGYALFFNGYPVKSDGPTHFGRTGIGGAGFPIVARTEDISGKRAGTYRDALTVTITPTAF